MPLPVDSDDRFKCCICGSPHDLRSDAEECAIKCYSVIDRPVSDDPGFPQIHPDPEPRTGPMASHAEATRVIVGLLVDVDDEIAKVIANALDLMGSSMVELSQRSQARHPLYNNCELNLDGVGDPVDAVTRVMDNSQKARE